MPVRELENAVNPSLANFPLPRRWREQVHPVPSVVAIVSRSTDGVTRHLLIKRKKEPYLGKWALIGGKWDFGESLAEAVIREVKEETGLSAVFSALLCVINHRLSPRADTDQGAHFVLFVCEVHPGTGNAREQTEGPISWVTAPQLEELNSAGGIIPTDYMIWARYGDKTGSLSYTEAEIVLGGAPTDAIDVVRFETLASNEP
jgi:ADP-ribose pyrophosphatase YjhB (NUDIX family)